MSTVHFIVDPQPKQHKSRACSNNGRSSRPRPILKSLSLPEHNPLPFSTHPPHSPHVHFPPTPTLTSTSFTHSAIVYDRAPIVVAENVCALPERNGRYYALPQRNKSPGRRVSGDQCHPSVGVTSGITVGPIHSTEPKGSYFHPRAYEACEPERNACAMDRRSRYFFSDSSSSSSSSESSSSSSESESDSDSSYDPLSPPSIPHVAVDTLTLGGTLSAYPPDSTLHSHFIPSRQHQFSNSRQQSQSVHHYACPPNPDSTMAIKPKKTGMMSDSRKVKGSSNSRSSATASAASRLAQFGGGFSDQSMVLEGCLGGF